MHGWKNAFDAGEWGLGRMANSLKLGCDCLGVIHYFDAVLATEQGEPYTVEHAICMHEEDYGILWKHHDLHGGTDEVRRSRRLVVSFIATVGNYEYGFYWYFYLDGNIQLEVKLTGIVSPMAIAPGETSPSSPTSIAPGLAAPHHQHLFSARLDLDVDGATNTVYEVEAEPVPAGPDNPWGNAFRPKSTRLDTELAARSATSTRRRAARGRSSTRRPRNAARATRRLQARARRCRRRRCSRHPSRASAGAPGSPATTSGSRPTTPTSDAPPASTRTSTRAATGCPRWTAADRSIVDTDVVLWYTFGVTHFVRPEDWPVMPVEYTGFLLSPFGFFDRNPALDVPPTNARAAATPTRDGRCGGAAR